MKTPGSIPALPRPETLLKLTAIVLACSLCCSCRLAYKNSLSGDGFVAYSNDGPAFLEKTGARIENIYSSLAELFEIPRPFPWTCLLYTSPSPRD